ncbi:hypothetical protein MXAN_4920 [Myxococcus xanthus DK 1622]|uniref:Uncharacterized protein n=1 Tax=Myxococcus xanthus (strain DK1622) TaxID=246197 RepID=Q1D2P7_MYXXD|nr:hypothetical protein MXAN_4920 [Myxococcus xanthus DK 1622]
MKGRPYSSPDIEGGRFAFLRVRGFESLPPRIHEGR